MKVFICWSGVESHAMASALAEWLPQVIQSIRPFFSSESIRKGVSWSEAIGAQLEATDFGILCLTPDNLKAEWILFEAGALSKKGKNAHVVPIITARMAPSDLTPPLSIFQATTTAKADMARLMKTINGAISEGALEESMLSRSFERWWPDLEAKFEEAAAQGSAGKPVVSRRPSEDMIEEILGLTRSIAVQQTSFASAKAVTGDLYKALTEFANGEREVPTSMSNISAILEQDDARRVARKVALALTPGPAVQVDNKYASTPLPLRAATWPREAPPVFFDSDDVVPTKETLTPPEG